MRWSTKPTRWLLWCLLMGVLLFTISFYTRCGPDGINKHDDNFFRFVLINSLGSLHSVLGMMDPKNGFFSVRVKGNKNKLEFLGWLMFRERKAKKEKLTVSPINFSENGIFVDHCPMPINADPNGINTNHCQSIPRSFQFWSMFY